MAQRPIVPCLWFDDQAEEAANFYAQAFGEGRVTRVAHYSTSKDNPTRQPRGSVLTVEFELEGQPFVGLNGGPHFKIGPNISFFAHVEFGNEAERIFSVLSVGGEVLMELGKYPWSDCYGWVQDRFGVSWQVMAGAREPGAAKIVPCLMFAGPQHHKAEAAIELYTGIFPQSRVLALARYEAGEGPEGTIKHGRFLLAGQELVAMDSHLEHSSSFNEGVSLQVFCADQAELDRYWSLLSADGAESRCGWLKDRFGVSWQIVPNEIGDWMATKDEAAKDRVYAALLAMGKLDIAVLQAAFAGAESKS